MPLLLTMLACNRVAGEQERSSGRTVLTSPQNTLGDTNAKTPSPILEKKAPAAPPRGTDRPRLWIFTRDNCLPCEIMHPWVEEIAKEQAGAIDIAEVNLDRNENRETGRTHRIRSVPTEIYLGKNGEEAHRHEGIATRDDMRRLLCRLAWISCTPNVP